MELKTETGNPQMSKSWHCSNHPADDVCDNFCRLAGSSWKPAA